MIKNRRIGKLYITAHFLDTEENIKFFEKIIVWLRFVPLRVEHRLDIRGLEMVGLSHRFDLIPNNEITPVYKIVVKETSDGKHRFQVERD